MDRIRIRGGNELNGVIPISGAKNAALPLMIASADHRVEGDPVRLRAAVPHLVKEDECSLPL